MTPGAIYSLGIIDHKFILGGELRVSRPGEDDSTQQLLRQFISERELTHQRLEETAKGGAKRYERTSHTVGGFASISWTATKDPNALKDEFALRLTAVASDEAENVTLEVQMLKAQRAKDPKGTKVAEQAVIEQFNLFDLSLQPGDVVIPFADKIMLKNTDTASRGLYQILLSHVEISTLYNQHKRNKDENDCWIATREDYAPAHLLVDRGAFRVLDPISPSARESFATLSDKLNSEGFGNRNRELRLKDISAILGKPRSTVQDQIAQLLSAEMLMVTNEPNDPGPRRYRLVGGATMPTAELGLTPIEEIPD